MTGADVIETDLTDAAVAFDRLLTTFVDPATTPAFVRRLTALLSAARQRESRLGWASIVRALETHELGRILRTAPMVRRCQWRAAGAEPYDIVEAFAMGWDDSLDVLVEAEAPGHFLNNAILETGIAAALRERRATLQSLIVRRAKADRGARVLALGAGRAPEAMDMMRLELLPVENWVLVDSAARLPTNRRFGAASRVDRISATPADWLSSRALEPTFDFIYMVDLMDGLEAEPAMALLTRAARLLRPGGELVVSAFLPAMPELALMEGALGWTPTVRDTSEVERLLRAADAGAARPGSCLTWTGTGGRLVFGALERSSWTG